MARGLGYNTGIPAGAFGGGAVVFNTQPYINFYMNQKFRQQAQQDAMFRYFGEMGRSLTPTGMAANDIPGLMDRKNAWQNYMMQNRQSIARPGLDSGRSYSQAMGMYNDMMSYINSSKDKMNNIKSLAPVMHSPQKAALLNEQTMNGIRQGSLPLDHPEYKQFDPASIQYNPPPFAPKDVNALRMSLSQYKPIDNPQVHSIGNMQEQITHNYSFSPGQLAGIASQGAVNYHTNMSYRNMIDKQLDDPNAYHNLNQVFKDHYGQNITSPEDFSTAYMLSLHPDLANKTEIRNIPINPWTSMNARVAGQEQYYDYRQADQQRKIDQTYKDANNWLGKLENQTKGQPMQYTHGETGKVEKSYPVNFTPDQINKIFQTKDISGKHNITPDAVRRLESGDYLPIHYQRDDNGKPIIGPNGNYAVDMNYTKPVSRDAVINSIISNKIVPKSTSTTTSPTTTQHVKKVTYGSGGLN